MKLLSFLILLFSLTFSYGNNLDIYQFQNANQAQQFHQLTYQLRCLVCQNETLADSNAPLAADLRNLIAGKIRAGQSQPEILNFLVTRYGDFILYQPPLMRSTWILWFAPFVLLFLGLAILYLSIVFLKYKKPKEPAI